MSHIDTGVRFLTMEEAEAYLFGTAPTHPIYRGDPRWEEANFEIGLMVFEASFNRAIPHPLKIEGLEWTYWKDLPKDPNGVFHGDGYTIHRAPTMPNAANPQNTIAANPDHPTALLYPQPYQGGLKQE